MPAEPEDVLELDEVWARKLRNVSCGRRCAAPRAKLWRLCSETAAKPRANCYCEPSRKLTKLATHIVNSGKPMHLFFPKPSTTRWAKKVVRPNPLAMECALRTRVLGFLKNGFLSPTCDQAFHRSLQSH